VIRLLQRCFAVVRAPSAGVPDAGRAATTVDTM
jgi:hypothetical protein